MTNQQKVILVHGYNKSSKDLRSLKKHLEKYNYEGILVDLPLTFKSVEYSSLLFKEKIDEIVRTLRPDEKVNLVGHSTGGIILRHYLTSEKNPSFIHRCVLLATPNHGSELARIAGKISRKLINILQTLRSLQPSEILAMNLVKGCSVEIGAIAGNDNNLLLGKLLKSDNDGRVSIEEVYYEELADFAIVPYGHKDIHYQMDVAQMIHQFLQTGKFLENI